MTKRDVMPPARDGETPSDERRIDELLREFQMACEDAAEFNADSIRASAKHRAILRNELRSELLAVAALRAEVAALRQFAGKAIQATRILEIGDWDGGDMQDAMVECGLLAPVEATEMCGEECRCAEYDDFPQTCYRLTELGQLAARSASGEDRHGT